MNTICTRFPCDQAYRQGVHSGPHRVSWGEEWAGPSLDADLRWSIAAFAEQLGDWCLQLRIGSEAIAMLPDEAARFAESLMRAWHCVTSAREREALYA